MMLTVLNVAYPLAPVGPDAVGGAEQVLTHLDAALTKAGHHSLVVACEGSHTQGELFATPRWRGPFDEKIRGAAAEHHRKIIRQILEQRPVDLVHLHGIDCHHYLPPTGVPTLITLHLPPDWYPPQVFRLERPQTFLNCVSATQRQACPPCPALLPEVENGVPTPLLAAPHGKRRFALSLGRICPEKGFHLALEAAARATMPLLLAGEIFSYEAHERYFQREIVPRLSRSRRFVGPVGLKQKRRLLSAAHCLLAPSLAPETSSLVAIEALACGTPVIAFPSGALAEIIEHGKTGFLVANTREMADAIQAVRSLDSEACRESVRQRFTLERMVEKYFELYHRVADGNEGNGFGEEAKG